MAEISRRISGIVDVKRPLDLLLFHHQALDFRVNMQ